MTDGYFAQETQKTDSMTIGGTPVALWKRAWISAQGRRKPDAAPELPGQFEPALLAWVQQLTAAWKGLSVVFVAALPP